MNARRRDAIRWTSSSELAAARRDTPVLRHDKRRLWSFVVTQNVRWRLVGVTTLVALCACSDGDDAGDTLATGPTTAGAGSQSSVTPIPDTSAANSEPAPTTVPPTGSAATVAPTAPPSAPRSTAPGTTAPPPETGPATTGPAATEPPATGSPSTAPAAGALTLHADGIADVDFGADPDSAIAAVRAVLGNPSGDSGWVDPFTISACPGSEYRRVSWNALSLQFSDSTSVADGRRHFFGYEYGVVGQTDAEPPGLTTPEGIGIGSTVGELRQTYPGVSVVEGEEGLSSSAFEVSEHGLAGLLTSAGDDGLVMLLVGGDFCGG